MIPLHSQRRSAVGIAFCEYTIVAGSFFSLDSDNEFDIQFKSPEIFLFHLPGWWFGVLRFSRPRAGLPPFLTQLCF
jgi:hypothetical protein